MTATQIAAQHLAQAIAGFRLADRDARQAIDRIELALAAARQS